MHTVRRSRRRPVMIAALALLTSTSAVLAMGAPALAATPAPRQAEVIRLPGFDQLERTHEARDASRSQVDLNAALSNAGKVLDTLSNIVKEHGDTLGSVIGRACSTC